MDATSTNEIRHVVFRVGDESFALPVSVVSSVVRYDNMTPVPLAAPAVMGLMNLRGRVIPVIDLGECLFSKPTHTTGQARIVVTEGEGGSAGLLVDSVTEVASFEPGRMQPFPAAPDGYGPEQALSAVIEYGPGELVVILDRDKLVMSCGGRRAIAASGEGGGVDE